MQAASPRTRSVETQWATLGRDGCVPGTAKSSPWEDAQHLLICSSALNKVTRTDLSVGVGKVHLVPSLRAPEAAL